MAGIDPLGLKGLVLDGGVAPERALIETPWSVLYRGVVHGTQDVVTLRVFRPLVRADRSEAFFSFVAQKADGLRALGASGASPRLRGAGRVHTSAGDVAYLAWDQVEGTSLVAELEQRAAAFTPSEFGTQLVGVARTLGQMGARGVVHRDVSPQSVVLSPRGAQLVEPGVGEILEAFSEELDPARRRYEGKNAAPEQVDASLGGVGPAADVFGFALLLIECLLPRIKRKTGPIANRKKRGLDGADRPTPKRFGLECPKALAEVLERALSPRPGERHAHVGELWSALVAAEPGFSALAAQSPAQAAPAQASSPPAAQRASDVSDLARTIATTAMPSMAAVNAVAPVAPVADASDFARTQISQTAPRMAARVAPSDLAQTRMVQDPSALVHAAAIASEASAPVEEEAAPVSRADGTHALGALRAMDAHQVLSRTPSVPPVGPVAPVAAAEAPAPAPVPARADAMAFGAATQVLGSVAMPDAVAAAPSPPPEAPAPAAAKAVFASTMVMERPSDASRAPSSPAFDPSKTVALAQSAPSHAHAPAQVVAAQPGHAGHGRGSSPGYGMQPEPPVYGAQGAQASHGAQAAQGHGSSPPQAAIHGFAPKQAFIPADPRPSSAGSEDDAAVAPPMESSKGLVIGLVVALVAVLGAGVYFFVRQSKPASSADPSVSAFAYPSSSASASAAPSDSAAPDASASSAPTDPAAPGASASAAASAEAPVAAPVAVTTPFDAKAATAALAASGKSIGTVCKKIKGPRGKGKAQVTFEPTGTVSEVALEKPYAKTATGACVEDELRKTSIAPFVGAARKVPASFMILWSRGD